MKLSEYEDDFCCIRALLHSGSNILPSDACAEIKANIMRGSQTKVVLPGPAEGGQNVSGVRTEVRRPHIAAGYLFETLSTRIHIVGNRLYHWLNCVVVPV